MSLPTDDKARKALPIWTFLMEYFPDAILAMVKVAVAGNEQHNPGQPLHWAREKSTDQMNTAFRHMWDHGRGVTHDTDGQYHLAKAMWRIGAELQLLIERDRAEESALVEQEPITISEARMIAAAERPDSPNWRDKEREARKKSYDEILNDVARGAFEGGLMKVELVQKADVYESNYGLGPEPRPRFEFACGEWNCGACYDQNSNGRAEWRAARDK